MYQILINFWPQFHVCQGAVLRRNADFEQMLKHVLYKEIFLSFTTKTKYYRFSLPINYIFPFLPFKIEYSSKAFIKHEILSKWYPSTIFLVSNQSVAQWNKFWQNRKFLMNTWCTKNLLFDCQILSCLIMKYYTSYY